MTLHTRYRPTAFKGIIGQDAVVRSFQHALDNETSRAFLFIGPPGCGKTSLARIGADYLGCKPKDIDEIDGATYTGIENMRTIISTLLYKPIGGGKRAIIVDEAHALSSATFKALLKSVEEPPEWLSWFFCTTELGKIPKNILTRCTKFDIKPVNSDLLFDLLEDTCKKEKLDLDEGILDICVKESHGSPRQALVNLGTCLEARNRAEAAELLKSAEDSPPVIELAQLLLDDAGWERIQALLKDLAETNPESIRHVIRGYVTKVVLNAKREDKAGKALEILDAFSEPFYQGDGISPVVMAVGRITLK